MHLVEWDKVCSPMDEGGLGIRNVRRFNQALLGKWLWRFVHEGAWWRLVLVAKYGSDWGGWCLGTTLDLMGWVFRNTFVRVGRFLGAISNLILSRALRFAFGMIFGVGDSALKEVFPGLFIIASLKEASIADNIERSNGIIQWNIQFTS
jgi:hypothetical protein